MKEGKIVPVEITISLIEKVLSTFYFECLFWYHVLFSLFVFVLGVFFFYEKIEFEQVSFSEYMYVIACRLSYCDMTNITVLRTTEAHLKIDFLVANYTIIIFKL